MDNSNRYTADIEMRELIAENSNLLMIINRFGISLGFGDSTVRKVCADNNVDEKTFLTVVNFLTGRSYNLDKIKLESLLGYLEKAHDYFLEFNLPAIRRKLIEALDYSQNVELSMLIMKFFDRYYREVKSHMDYENENVFTYIRSLFEGVKSPDYSIKEFAEKHNRIDEKLTELKQLIIRYYPDRKDNNLMYSVLYDIISCEQDLYCHCLVEDELLVPAVAKYEQKVIEHQEHQELNDLVGDNDSEGDEDIEEHTNNELSKREKDIIICVAKGMSNKEIADALFISVNTVTKHRYNITTKLQIHSPVGLTIYALVNHLVRLDEISSQLV